MLLTRHATPQGAAWAVDGRRLPDGITLGPLLALPQAGLVPALAALAGDEAASGPLLPPIDPEQEVWASGVTYLRSRVAREAESVTSANVYEQVYDAERPELFFKALGWRVVGPDAAIRIRRDSAWNVPEPELTLVINRAGEIVGFTAGNDVSSRDIEGANPLYLPQAKIYTGSCALGPGIRLAAPDELADLPIDLRIRRSGADVFTGATRSSLMKRTLPELAAYLGRELDFPYGVFLMTGTGIVPGEAFTLQSEDVVEIEIGGMRLVNPVE